MSTKVYGQSDDLIDFYGDVSGEVSCFGTDDCDRGVFIVFNDGTVLEAKYGKGGRAIWGLTVLQTGSLFERIEPCEDEDANPCSDIVHFRDGLKHAWAATEWAPVR